MAAALAGRGPEIRDLRPAQERNLRICFEAHAGKAGKVSLSQDCQVALHEDPEEEEREGAALYSLFHAFGMTRFRPGARMGGGHGLLEREIEELLEECDDDELDFAEVKALASRTPFLEAEWKAYHDIRVQEGQTKALAASPDREPWLDSIWQIQESFRILTSSSGNGDKLEMQMLFEILHTCGEEMGDGEFDDFIQLCGLKSTGNVDVAAICAKLREYATADPYHEAADRDSDYDDPPLQERGDAPRPPGAPVPESFSKRGIIRQAGALISPRPPR